MNRRPRSKWLSALVIVALAAFPFFAPFSLVGVGVQAAIFTVVASSLVLLVGWVGQISLAHAALVGIGAYATGWATAAWNLRFPFSVVAAAVIAAAVAAALGSVALRVRGLYLAVATLIFSWMADAFLFRQDVIVRHSIIDVPVIGSEAGVPRFDTGDRTTMFFLAWGVALLVLFIADNLRRSRTGRAFFAVRGSEVGAASLGIDVTRYKLLAFTVSGFFAGIAGSLTMLDAQSLSPEDFGFTRSLFFLSIAVVGGLSSLGGTVASAILFAGLNEVFFRVTWLGNYLDLVSAVLLTVMLLVYRGGLAAVPSSVQHLFERVVPARVRQGARGLQSDIGQRVGTAVAVVRRVARGVLQPVSAAFAPVRRRVAGVGGAIGQRVRLPRRERPELEDASTPTAAPAVAVPVKQVAIGRGGRRVVLDAAGITVRFGGLTAVNDASVQVCEGEIVGLIGPNGAGKTTLFNAIAGLNQPAAGAVTLLGEDVTSLPVHVRAALGVARTFQAIQLFPELDVSENLLVATHLQNHTGFLRHAFATEAALTAELHGRDRVREVIVQLGLEDVAHRRIADLPFGILRVVELARALVTGFPFVMLDEPASGLDNTETDAFAQQLTGIRDTGKTLLLIEHDVAMVTSVCDFIYVINRGEIIASGTPAEIQANVAVQAAYLGEPVTEPAPRRTRARRERRDPAAV